MRDSENDHENHPKTVNDLIDRIGGAGNYQRMMLIIFCGTWLVTGATLLGTPFIFLNQTF